MGIFQHRNKIKDFFRENFLSWQGENVAEKMKEFSIIFPNVMKGYNGHSQKRT